MKLAAKQQRILCTRLVSVAWMRTTQSVDFERAFLDIGYTWVDDSPISLRTLPGYIFDPTTVSTQSSIDGENDDDDESSVQQANVVNHRQITELRSNSMTQLKLDQFISRH